MSWTPFPFRDFSSHRWVSNELLWWFMRRWALRVTGVWECTWLWSSSKWLCCTPDSNIDFICSGISCNRVFVTFRLRFVFIVIISIHSNKSQRKIKLHLIEFEWMTLHFYFFCHDILSAIAFVQYFNYKPQFFKLINQPLNSPL